MDGTAGAGTPIIIALIVGLIGAVGLFAALRAAYQMNRERAALRRGRSDLRDLPMRQDTAFDYRAWINERGALLADSHFADHLLAAADATKSGRAVTLHELHEISARREARRFGARLSGGVTALLLVCGIAGTLWAIKPVLGSFNLSANPAGEVPAVGNAEQATRMIRDLGSAFSPSLVALALTVLVAMMRGLYAYGRGELAGELDRLDLEDLFPRFPPPSLSQELDGVRVQLAGLAAQMLASQRNLDGFVQRLTDAAKGFNSDAPPLQAASKRFVAGVGQLSPKLDALSDAIANHLGATSPLVSRFDGLLAVSGEVHAAAAQMRLVGAALPKHLLESHRLLKDTADTLPGQVQAACATVSSIIADAVANALANACTTAVQRLDDAAAPLRDAARSIAVENHALKADTSQAIATLTSEVQALRDSTTETLRTDLNRGLDDLGNGVEARLDDAEQEFKRALSAALGTITVLHSSANDTIATVAETVGRMEQLQPRVTMAVQESAHTREAIASAGDKVKSLANDIGTLTEQVDGATKALVAAKQSDQDASRQQQLLVQNLSALNATLVHQRRSSGLGYSGYVRDP